MENLCAPSVVFACMCRECIEFYDGVGLDIPR